MNETVRVIESEFASLQNETVVNVFLVVNLVLEQGKAVNS